MGNAVAGREAGARTVDGFSLHPWNTGFAWGDAGDGEPVFLTTDQRRSFDEDGFVLVPDLLSGDALERTVVEIDGFAEDTEKFLQSMPDSRLMVAEAGAISFTTHLVTKSPWLRRLASSRTIAEICVDLVGPDVRLYWDQAVYKRPEKPRRFPWHQDNGYTYVEPQQYLTVWLALTDATVDNGCPWVVPGVHRFGTLEHRYIDPLGFECFSDHPDKLPVPVPAGSAVVFSSLTPHLTGPNTTDAVRKAYILQYAPDGAEILRGDPAAGDAIAREACSDPERQFMVAKSGRPGPDAEEIA